MHKKILYFLSLLLLSFNLSAAQPDWTSYTSLLEKHITPKTVSGIPLNYVNYQALFNDPLFPDVIAIIERFSTDTLTTKEEKLSFYINAYNIFAMKVVHDNWPLDSIKDAGSWISPVWKQTAGKINGKDISLGEIEHEILRPLGEPRIHFAIVCASLSCPDLRAEAFTVERLNEQLDDQTRTFLRNAKKGLKIKGSTAEVSKIFDWFEDDFKTLGGVKAFIKSYMPTLTVDDIDSDLPYDWSLNGS